MHHRDGVREDEQRIGARVCRRSKRLVEFRRAEEGNIDRGDAQSCMQASTVARHSDCSPGWFVFDSTASVRSFGRCFLEQLDSLSRQFERKERGAREIAAGLLEALDDAQLHRVATQRKQDGNVGHRGHRAGRGAARHRKVDVATPQFGNDLTQRLGIAERIAQFEGNVLSLNVAVRAQALAKAFKKRIGLRCGGNPKDAINLCRLLCERGEPATPTHHRHRQ